MYHRKSTDRVIRRLLLALTLTLMMAGQPIAAHANSAPPPFSCTASVPFPHWSGHVGGTVSVRG